VEIDMAYPFVPVATTSFAGEDWGGAFDAVLSRTESGVFSYKLTIKLRIMLRQMNPNPLSPWTTMGTLL
jgi:hypothetical protein